MERTMSTGTITAAAPAAPSTAQLALRLAGFTLALLLLDLGFWIFVGQALFSDGDALTLALSTASGPLLYQDVALASVLYVAIFATPIVGAFRWRSRQLARLGGYLGIALWFACGFFLTFLFRGLAAT
jgi:hypothetical protein